METEDQQLEAVIRIAEAAGAEILRVYNQEAAIDVSLKDDNSPLTEADRRAHNLIVEQLLTVSPTLPILSEESDAIEAATRRSWQRYWLVDPLDGTKEFIKRNGEFTVNIALIDSGQAVLGVVHVPVSGITYSGRLGVGAWKREAGTTCEICTEDVGAMDNADTDSVSRNSRPINVVASRSHRGELLDRLIDTIESRLGAAQVVSMGSSLKICLLAEGKADIYPRLAPTCEWDTAAAHAVLSAAGGEIYDTQFRPLRYNQKDELLNPHFLAIADLKFDWRQMLESSLSN